MKNAPFLRAGIFLAIFFAAVTIGYFLLRPSDELPIYHPSQLDVRLVDRSVRDAKGEHHIKPFRLIDQDGDSLFLADVQGKVLLTDFFFTTCGTICPKMSTQMARVQEAFAQDDRVLLLSHSVTPEADSVPVLHAYAKEYGVEHHRWRLLTGDRKQIYDLARTSYFAVMDHGDGGPDDFVHTENFVLVDPQGRLRGFYDGTKAKEVDQAIKDMRKLLKEMKG
ncbi:MAG TPA: SCO family protein [Flavobacteriales bacterium]|nr:SCO family protein [Flavobacteriales bacterium]HRO40889.1 SCO family protein [Flavobacteriales bacterium]HRP82847.1 SCO family protein [Flavobacteriales bacterium]HRQ85307.1 SCO family protein [Flavobacteriales bacterium]